MGNALKHDAGSMQMRPGYNYQMCLMSVVGIIFVVLGHIKNDFSGAGTFYGWFPYYSFHMPLFFFISGYFYRDLWENDFLKNFPRFLWKKTKSMLIPYYLINGAFLLIQTIFFNTGIFLGTPPVSIKDWLVQPWVRVEPNTFSHPTWFLFALFLSEIFFLLLRKFFSLFIRKPLLKEIILLGAALALSFAAAGAVSRFEISGPGLVYLRSAYLIFYLQLGTFYRKYLERKEAKPGWFYFLVIFAVQFAVILYTANSPLYYSYVKLQLFGIGRIVAMVTAINGIALWLGITRWLSEIPVRSRFIMFVGDNTKYIMAFHLFGIFLVNTAFRYLYTIPAADAYLHDFNPDDYMTQVYYVCNSNPRVVVIYFVISIAFSLLLAKLIGIVKNAIRLGSGRLAGRTRE